MKISIYTLVKHAIDQADPIHLLESGAPDDEYEPEIRDIASRVGGCTTLEEIEILLHEVFGKWFDAQIAGPRERYRGWPKSSGTGCIRSLRRKLSMSP